MLRKFLFYKLTALMLFCAMPGISFAVTCSGKWPNPITDVCWTCMFPIYIGGARWTNGVEVDNGDPPPPLTCQCPAPPPVFIRYGVGVSYWEPARMAEVVRTPMCSPTLNGKVLGTVVTPEGTHGPGANSGMNGLAHYHVHWFTYPVISWLSMLTNTSCAKGETFDISYMTEYDAAWNDDEMTFSLNPEAVLFANPIAQVACAADSVKAAVTKFGIDALFWCSGSQGSVYPIDGNVAGHVGGVDSTLDIVHRFIFKMHREFLALDTSTYGALCADVPQPIMRKNQYKQQMVWPLPQTLTGLGLGVPSAYWAWGKEYPYVGEDFAYLVWRKRICCAF